MIQTYCERKRNMRNTKQSTRHRQILMIIEKYHIETQDDLIRHLRDQGIVCTQATVSRDIKELKLIKVAEDNGKYRYAQPKNAEEKHTSVKYDKILQETVISVEYAGNLVVIKTYTGMAMAACAAIDALHWNGMLGTIAGDDTIFTAVYSEDNAKWFAERIERMLNSKKEEGN